MSILDMFKTKPQEQQQQQQQGSAPEGDAVAAADLASKKAEQNINNPAKTDKNPLDIYQEMLNNAAKNSDIQAPSFSLDPKVVSDVASKLDFTQGINPELLQKATSGDANAMMALIAETSRNAYRAAIEHTTKLTDTHLNQRSDFESKRINSGVKKQLTSDALASSANLSHPLVRAEVNQIAERLSKAPEFADASPKQIAEAALDYFKEIHAVVNPPAKTAAQKKQEEGFDYMQYFTGGAG